MTYDKIATPGGIDYLSKLFSRIGGEPLVSRCISRAKSQREEKAPGFSMKNLIAKKDIFGDVMEIV